jgi:hypothetical protein
MTNTAKINMQKNLSNQKANNSNIKVVNKVLVGLVVAGDLRHRSCLVGALRGRRTTQYKGQDFNAGLHPASPKDVATT